MPSSGTSEHPVHPRVELHPGAPRRTKLAWQVRTEQHVPSVKNIPYIQRPNTLGAAGRWISFPEDRSIVSCLDNVKFVKKKLTICVYHLN